MINLVGSLFNSESDPQYPPNRYPRAYFAVKGPEGGFVSANLGQSGTINPVELHDFVEVLPGQEFDPYMWTDDKHGFVKPRLLQHSEFRKPGVYTVVFHYSTASNRFKHWAGGGTYRPK